MTPQEQELIMTVSQRLRNANMTEKDKEAEGLIQREIGSQQDATYLLTQAVLIQEYALKQAQERIGALEGEVKQAREQSAQQKGSFLGGLFGGGGPSSAAPGSATRTGAPPVGHAAGPGSGFGDFMKSAASVAMGVAGGQLLFSGLSNLFGEQETGNPLAAEEATGAEQEEMLAQSDSQEPNYGVETDDFGAGFDEEEF